MVTGQPVRRHPAGGRGAVVLRARPARDAARRPVHPDLPHRHARDALRVRPHAQRDLAGGPRIRRRARRSTPPSSCSRPSRSSANAGSRGSKPRSPARSRCGRRCSPRTVTAVIVFLPIVFMRDAVSQLFADLALTISIAVIASLIVAVTALPLAASRWLNAENVHKGSDRPVRGDRELDRALDGFARSRRYITVGVLFLAPVVLTWVAAAAARLSAARQARRHRRLHPAAARHQHRDGRTRVRAAGRASGSRPTWRARRSRRSRTTTCSPGAFGTQHRRAPARSRTTSTSSASSSTRRSLVGFPDTQSFAAQGNLFGGFGDGRNIDFQLQATDFPGAAGRRAHTPRSSSRKRCRARRCRPSRVSRWPSRSCGCNPDDRRLNEVGWTRGDIGTVVRALGDGMFVGEYFDGERRLDMILRASKWDSPEALADTPVATPVGSVCPSANWSRSSPRWAQAACGASMAIAPSGST